MAAGLQSIHLGGDDLLGDALGFGRRDGGRGLEEAAVFRCSGCARRRGCGANAAAPHSSSSAAGIFALGQINQHTVGSSALGLMKMVP